MTTIATDGKTIASDSLRCRGYERMDTATKKIRIAHGRIYAFTGDFAAFAPAIKWHNKGADPNQAPKAHKEGGWRLVVIDQRGIFCLSDQLPYEEEYVYPTAFGSGADYALAALKLGKSPSEAISLASELDIATGGPIQCVDIAEALARPLKEAAE